MGSSVTWIWTTNNFNSWFYIWYMDRNFNCTTSLTIGATFLYFFANYFVKDLVEEKI